MASSAVKVTVARIVHQIAVAARRQDIDFTMAPKIPRQQKECGTAKEALGGEAATSTASAEQISDGALRKETMNKAVAATLKKDAIIKASGDPQSKGAAVTRSRKEKEILLRQPTLTEAFAARQPGNPEAGLSLEDAAPGKPAVENTLLQVPAVDLQESDLDSCNADGGKIQGKGNTRALQ